MVIDRLVDELDRSYAEAQERMSDPAVYNDHRQAAEAGTPAEKLDVDTTVTFVPGTGITAIELAVVGSVPGIDEPAFLHAAGAAKENCPVSMALASVPEITLRASLA